MRSRHIPGPRADLWAERLGVAALAALVALACWAAVAQAGPPSHPPVPGDPIGGFALDHACGAATDSSGNIYVSNAGNDGVEVFSPAGTHLATIPNSNGPCGLAVDTTGCVFVSESATGDVVRYCPDVYPFIGAPFYGAPTTSDSSGQAKGIAVDPTDDRLYVARGGHVAAYQSDGTLGINEVQLVTNSASGGSYTLNFRGQTTAPLPFDASAAQVQAALEALSTIGDGDVSVQEGTSFGIPRNVTFVGVFAGTDVEQLGFDGSGLTGGSGSVFTRTAGWDGLIGDGDLTAATGVAAYTSGSGDRFVSVADDESDVIKVFAGAEIRQLALRHTIDGSETPDGDLGFGAAGAQVAVDPASGHLFVYDHAHTVVDEFEATGRFFARIDHDGFADAEPTAVAVHPRRDEVQLLTINASGGSFRLSFEGDRTTPLPRFAAPAEVQAALEALASIGAGNVAVNQPSHGGPYRIRFTGALAQRDMPLVSADASGLTGSDPSISVTNEAQGSGPGRVYVTAGAGPGAKLLAFGPVAPSRRPARPDLSFALQSANAIAVDSGGNRYVADDVSVQVYDPGGVLRATLFGSAHPRDLAVDSAGNLYVLDEGPRLSDEADDEVHLYTAGPGFSFSGPTTLATVSTFGDLGYIGLNPANDHLFLGGSRTVELDSAANDSAVVNSFFAGTLSLPNRNDIAVHGASGNVYLAAGSGITVLDPSGTEVLARIDGLGSPRGPLGALTNGSIAVEQASGHVLVHDPGRGVAEEYEGSGAFVAEFGSFLPGGTSGIALDESGGPNDGSVHVAHGDRVHAFGPLSYGEPPAPVTGVASGIGGGAATLNGTVDPRGFAVSDCHFDYVEAADFEANGFGSAVSVACAESLAEIGAGDGPVPVHADIGGLDPQTRYRFRLVAANEFGSAESDPPGLFGPPLLTTRAAQPVLYREATIRATVDPSGLATSYRVEYGDAGACASNPCSSTAERTLAGGAGPTAVEVPLFGLAEGTTYHYRVLVSNEAGSVEGSDQSLTTLARPVAQDCPNAEFRTGPSARLPDCRAYELVTPADMRGASPYATDNGTAGAGFNNWLVAPHGEGAGESVAYFVDQPVPGFDGNGLRDGYRARRGAEGWTSELFGPTFHQEGGGSPNQQGVASDQRYSFWSAPATDSFEGTLERGFYLRTPSGFEPVGRGRLGTDLEAQSRFVTAGGGHVVFASDARLEPAAPPAGTRAVYDRAAGEASAEVVSLLPGELTPPAGQDAAYVGSTEDGRVIAFRLGGALYVRRDNGETVKVADAPNSFAGISEDGGRVFYSTATFGDRPGDLFAFELDAEAATQVAPDSIFVNVSNDGSRVYFTSTEVLDDAGLGTPGADNLYVWDGSAVRFIGVLDPQDFGAFSDGLDFWSGAVSAGQEVGRAGSPTRSTPDGGVLVFDSHAQLTSYDNDGFAQIYRYDAAAVPGAELTCVSCHPSRLSPSGHTRLWSEQTNRARHRTTVVPNVTDDGGAVFFESSDPLLPEDANSATDVYEWKAPGTGGCERAGGCLALISSGIGDGDSFLYGMSADGRDVFFRTNERLHGADVAQGSSLYDARVGGGFPDPAAGAPCQGDGCQGDPAPAPSAPSPGSAVVDGAGNPELGGGRCERLERRAGAARRKARALRRQARRVARQARRLGDRGRRRPARARRVSAKRRSVRAEKQARRAKRLRAQAGDCREGSQ